MADVGFVGITVITQPSSKRTRGYVFSRVYFDRNVASTIVPSVPGARKFIITRRARGRREPIVVQLRGHVDSPWFVPPGPPAPQAIQMAWPHVRQHQKQYWWP